MSNYSDMTLKECVEEVEKNLPMVSAKEFEESIKYILEHQQEFEDFVRDTVFYKECGGR